MRRKRFQILWLFVSALILFSSEHISIYIANMEYAEVDYQVLSSNIYRKVRVRGEVTYLLNFESKEDGEEYQAVTINLDNNESNPVHLIVPKDKYGIEIYKGSNIEVEGRSRGLKYYENEGGYYPFVMGDRVVRAH